MRRRLPKTLSAILLALCVATGVMWARSYWYADFLYYTIPEELPKPPGPIFGPPFPPPEEHPRRPSQTFGLVDYKGRVQFDLWTQYILHGSIIYTTQGQIHTKGPWDWGSAYIGISFSEIDDEWHEPDKRAQFGYGTRTYYSSGIWPSPTPRTYRFVTVPYWSILLALGTFPVIRFLRRRRRTTPGRCSKCGYDLRATPARCPECGATAQKYHAEVI